MISPAELQDLMGKWWLNYDEGNFDVLGELLTDDVRFTCRTDSEEVAWAEFVRADLSGRDDVMEWQVDHRLNSPYPLRHNGANVHFTGDREGDAPFAMYVDVTHVVDQMPASIPGGVVRGKVRQLSEGLRICEFGMVLDTMTSQTFSEVRAS